jgi:hypothetical protein
MGSSFLSLFDDSAAYSATSSLENFPLCQTDSAWIEILAVVRVPAEP